MLLTTNLYARTSPLSKIKSALPYRSNLHDYIITILTVV